MPLIKHILVLTCLAFAGVALAGMEPDRQVAWNGVAGDMPRKALVAPNGDLVVTSENGSASRITRVDPVSGLLWERTFQGAVRDIEVAPSGQIFATTGNKVLAYSSDGILQQTLTFDVLLVQDLTYDASKGVLFTTANQTDMTFSLNLLKPQGGREILYTGSGLIVDVTKIVSANETYFAGKESTAEDANAVVRRFDAVGVQTGTGSFYDPKRIEFISAGEPLKSGVPMVVSAYGSRLQVIVPPNMNQNWFYFQESWDSGRPIVGSFTDTSLMLFVPGPNFPNHTFTVQLIKQSSFYSRTRTDVVPRKALPFLKGILWWGIQTVDPSDFYLEKIAATGFTQDTFAGLFRLESPSPIFAVSGPSFWIVGAPSSSGNSRLAVRFTSVPTAYRDDYETSADTTLTVNAFKGVLANDELTDGGTAELVQPPAHGTVQLNPDGSFTYTPNTGYKGYDNIHYRFVREGVLSNTAVFAVAVGTFAYRHTITPGELFGGNPAKGLVTLNKPAPQGGLTVSLTSTSSVIQVPASVTVAWGETTAQYQITTSSVNEDTTRSVIANGGYVPLHATLKLLRPRIRALAILPNSLTGGKSTTCHVELDAPAGSSGARVALSDNSSAVDTPDYVDIPPNAKTASFTITTKPVASGVTRTVYAAYGKTLAATLFINQARISVLSLSPSSIAGGNAVLATVTFDGVLGGSITLQAAGTSNSVSVPYNVTVPAGASKGTFTVTTGAVDSTRTAAITVSQGVISRSAELTIVPAVLKELQITPNVVKGGDPSSGLVLFNGKVAAGTLVSLGSNSSAVQVPGNVLIPANGSSGSFGITTTKVSATAVRQVGASSNGITKVALITLNP